MITACEIEENVVVIRIFIVLVTAIRERSRTSLSTARLVGYIFYLSL